MGGGVTQKTKHASSDRLLEAWTSRTAHTTSLITEWSIVLLTDWLREVYTHVSFVFSSQQHHSYCRLVMYVLAVLCFPEQI